MGGGQTFLDRLGRRQDVRLHTQATEEDVQALVDSVGLHLRHLLNSRHGMSEALPDYGLPALADLTVGGGDHARRIQEAIRTTIEKYEPRLRRVRVLPRQEGEPAGRTLSFRIEAVLVGRSGEHQVRFETDMGSAGQLSVSE